MVSIDTVYQRVLALANKEQRGYITPQEFNLFANQAQMDIFEQYFYDLNQFSRIPGNNKDYANPISIIQEKLDIFKDKMTLSGSDNIFDLPEFYYRPIITLTGNNKEIKRLDIEQAMSVVQSPLTKPSLIRPIYYIDNNNRINVLPETITSGNFYYYKKPTTVNWSYIVVGESAVVNTNVSAGYQNFELHPSEETDLVIKILGLAGITLKDPNLYQIASTEDNKNTQQEKQ